MSHLRIVGQTELRTSEGQGAKNHLAVSIMDNVVIVTVRGPEATSERRVESSSDPAVVRFLELVISSLDATAARYDVSSDLPPRGPVGMRASACPACGGEGWFLCDLCEGEGTVSIKRANTWRKSIDIKMRPERIAA